jgi:hypothetical protein
MTLTETAETIAKRFASKPWFAIPAWFVTEGRKAVLRRHGFRWTETKIRVDATGDKFAALIGVISIEALVFNARTQRKLAATIRDVMVAFGDVGLGAHRVTAWHRQTLINLLLPQSADVWTENQARILGKPDTSAPTVDAIREELSRFSRITGLGIRFIYGGDVYTAPMPASGDNVIRILDYKAPPGEVSDRQSATAFGFQLIQSGQKMPCLSPAAGRGEVLDGGDGPAIQAIGSDHFLLFPLVISWNEKTGAKILHKALEAIWKRRTKRTAAIKPLSAPAVAQKLEEWHGSLLKDLRTQLQGVEDKIVTLQDELTAATVVRQRLADLIGAVDRDSRRQEIVAGLEGQVRAIRRLPGVTGVSFVDSGLHVTTKEIVIEHAGKRHPVGAMTVRFGQRHTVSIWPERSPHPSGIPHPHVPRDGTPCFGNATSAIATLIGDFRLVEAAKLIVDWLEHGYAHDLAFNKITEWTEDGGTIDDLKPLEPIATGVDLRPDGSQADHPDRRGHGGSEVRLDAGVARDP